MNSHIEGFSSHENEESKIKQLLEYVTLGNLDETKRFLAAKPDNAKLLLSNIPFAALNLVTRRPGNDLKGTFR